MELNDENLFQTIGVWNIVQTGFTELAEGTKLLSSAIKELERNKQLNRIALHYLSTKVLLHVVKKFTHAKTADET